VKRLIVTGDDFGLSLPVNEAIEEAHRRGILNTASLMVGAKATRDAVERALQLPSLHVGLHLVLVEGSPLLPPQVVPDLVNRRGQFSSHLVRAGIHFFFRPEVRRQLEAEIRAQFQAFQKTGLPLDHVNSHHHMHLHPTILGLILRVGREYGIRAVRLPCEPLIPSWRASRKAFFRKMLASLFLSPWLILLRSRFRRSNVHSNNFVFGMNDSGHMHLDLVLRFLKYLPQGVTEIYFHPEAYACPEIDHPPGGNPGQEEFEVLTSPTIQKALLASSIQRIAFSDL
jgi:hopanoid biosynthesis associated protein HpnK